MTQQDIESMVAFFGLVVATLLLRLLKGTPFESVWKTWKYFWLVLFIILSANFLKKEILQSGYQDRLGAGLVLTGGATMLPGTQELAERVFDLPIKRSLPTAMEGLDAQFVHPSYSSVLGLVEWVSVQKRGSRMKRKNTNNVMEPVLNAGKQIKSWFTDLV